MKKYPMKSNWISYARNKEGNYIVHNHVLDDDIEMTGDEIELLERLDGKENPNEILRQEFGMTRIEAENYVENLTCEGVLRQGNSVFGMLSMRTIIKIYDSSKFREIAIVLLGLIMIAFIPIMYAGYRSAYSILVDYDLLNYSSKDGPIWLGIVVGIIVGLILHEINHAIACCAFGGPVMEFGITFRGFPAAYTLLDYKKVSRWGQIITDLIGVVANLMVSAISVVIIYNFGTYINIFTMIAAVNLELALVNLLFIDGVDGCHAISKMLGPSDIYENCGVFMKNLKFKASKTALSESDKTVASMFRVFKLGKLIYPILILFNLCIAWGW